MAGKSETFEASVKRLEEIVKKLEGGELPLDEAMALYEEGTKLVKSSAKLLDEAELKVVKLAKGPDGAPTETEFTENG